MPVTEHEVETIINMQLAAWGWQLDARTPKRNVYKQQARTDEQNRALKPNRPDYVLYAYCDSDKPSIVIETKRPS